jgi:hypothetical protein
MPFIPANVGICKAAFFHTIGGETCIVTAHVYIGTTVDGAAISGRADQLAQRWASTTSGSEGPLSLMSNRCTFVRCELTDVSVPDGFRSIGATQNVAGAIANSPVPNEQAMVVSLKTAYAGRSARGRAYLPGFAISSYLNAGTTPDPNHWDAGTVAAAGTRFARVFSGTLLTTLSVVSYYHGKDSSGRPLPRATAVDHPVTNVTAKSLIGTQRRRMPKV